MRGVLSHLRVNELYKKAKEIVENVDIIIAKTIKHVIIGTVPIMLTI